MTRSIAYVIALAVSAGALSCAGTPNTPADESNAAAAATNSDRRPAANANSGLPSEANAPTETPVAENRRTLVDHSASGPPPRPYFTPAGEDSLIAVSMKPDGSVYEIRVFKNHPQLKKVEAIWHGMTEKTLTFRLRNGRILERRTGQLQDLQTATTADLLIIAGLRPAATTKTRSTNKKKHR